MIPGPHETRSCRVDAPTPRTGFIRALATAAGLWVAACGDGGTAPPPVESNLPPQARGTIAPASLTVGDTLVVDVASYFADPDGDALAYEAMSSNTVVATAGVVGNTVSVAGVAEGAAAVTVTARDPGGLEATQGFGVRVEAALVVVTLTSAAAAPEGGMAVLELEASAGPAFPISVPYTLGADSDPATVDADRVDYGPPSRVVELPTGVSRTSIEIEIADDDDIEPAREVFVVTLDAPASGARYELGGSVSATVTIEEGVCDRTPQIADEIVRRANLGDCAQPDANQLSGIRVLDFSEEGPAGATPGAEPFDSLRALDFSGLSALDTLYLSGNQLTALPSGVFSGLSNLVHLDLSGVYGPGRRGFDGRLADLPEDVFSGLARLESLDLRHNMLRELPDSLFAGLSSLRELDLRRNRVAFPGRVFSGLSNLVELNLSGNELSVVPADAFRGLTSLEYLSLSGNRPLWLPEAVLSDLSSLKYLYLGGNLLRRVPPRLFAGLSRLERLSLAANEMSSLPSGLFADLASLQVLDLAYNELSELPRGVFLGLVSLRRVTLHNNPGAPFTLTLEPRRTDSDRLDAPSPARVAVTVAEGAPFAMAIPLTVEGGELYPDTATIAAGAERSAGVTVTRAVGGRATTRLEVGVPPPIPEEMFGIRLAAGDGLTLFAANRAPVVASAIPAQTVVAGDSGSVDVSRHFNDPDGDSLTYSASSSDAGVAAVEVSGSTVSITGVVAGEAIITVTARDPGNLEAEQSFPVNVSPGTAAPTVVTLSAAVGSVPEGGTAILELHLSPAPVSTVGVAFTLGPDSDPNTPDADSSDYEFTSGQVWLRPGNARSAIAVHIHDDADIEPVREAFSVTLDPPASDAGYKLGTESSVTVTIEEGVCDRTPQVRDEIAARAGIQGCSAAEAAHLAAVEVLDLSVEAGTAAEGRPGPARTGRGQGGGDPIVALRERDFVGLSSLDSLNLGRNRLAQLPARVFTGLTSLRWLDLQRNDLAELPEGIFRDLSNLAALSLRSNDLTELRDDGFSDLNNLRKLDLGGNSLGGMSEGVFNGLSSLEELEIFASRLTVLPEGIFQDLQNLKRLGLPGNLFTHLPEGLFAGLSRLEWLRLHNNQLTSLPPEVFSGLSGLEQLWLNDNQLPELPAGVFAGLSSLGFLYLGSNPGAPFTFTLELQRTDSDNLSAPSPATVAVTIAEGAPFAMDVPLRVSGGTLSADTVRIATGATGSGGVTVTRSVEAQAATRVETGPPPPIPRLGPTVVYDGIQLATGDPILLFATGTAGASDGVRAPTPPASRSRTAGAAPPPAGGARSSPSGAG